MGNSKQIVDIGGVKIGGDYPIAIQSMLNTKTGDIEASLKQIKRLEDAGCEIVRLSVSSVEEAKALSEIKKRVKIPLVADIQFDHKLALLSMENGVDKVRINPGYVGDKEKVKEVVDFAHRFKVPIRIGVNSGSLRKEELLKYGKVTAEGLSESAVREVEILEELGFFNIVVSIKSSDVMMGVLAYKMFKEKKDYPLHIGVTEAGTVLSGSIKNAVGVATMLNAGLGDTVRVSLTGDPVEEIHVAKQILSALGLREEKLQIVSCPTCGRTNIDLVSLANDVEKMARELNCNLKIAVMGCAVNGPGEARESDLGIAGGDGEGLIFKKGEILKKVPESQLLSALREEILNYEA